ncbi:MAG: protein translocase SEC61 complex subunit gamma [Candidatus ainarchaeum sp.]|nr:protein translocase SEC61 complex subunit gamma [Candidatus ainarchaeum sp.]
MSGLVENSKRVFTVAKKPDKQEFWGIAKSTGLGILFIGLVGFVIYLIFQFFLL